MPMRRKTLIENRLVLIVQDEIIRTPLTCQKELLRFSAGPGWRDTELCGNLGDGVI